MTQANVQQSSKLSRIATFTVRKLWMLFAILIVLIALLMSFMRYSLPLISEQKDRIEQYIENKYEVDVDIGELSAIWQKNGPSIMVRNLKVEQGQQSPISLHIDEVLLDIDFWPTIFSGRLQNQQVLLSKLSAQIDVTRIETNESEFPIVEALENILLEQLSSFVANDSFVSIVTSTGTKNINIPDLSWVNKGDRHQGVGQFSLQDLSQNSASFILDLRGNVERYHGSLYANAKDIDLGTWIKGLTELDNKLVSSKGNAEFLGKINNGRFTRIDGFILPSEVIWENQGSQINTMIEGGFAAVRNHHLWDFALQDLTIQVQDEQFKTSIQGYVLGEQQLLFEIKEPVALAPLIGLTNIFSHEIGDTLANMDAQANLGLLKLLFDEDGTHLLASVKDITWNEYADWPGAENLNADVMWHNSNGKITVNADSAWLEAQQYLQRRVALTNINIPITITREQDWNIAIRDGGWQMDGIPVAAEGEYALKDDFLSLAVAVDEFDLANAPNFFPREAMGDETIEFLNRAFTGGDIRNRGKVTSGKLIWQGKTAEFPYANGEGIFQSTVEVRDADFIFASDWPELNHLDIDLLFENEALFMSSQRGELAKVQLSNLDAVIPELSDEATLTITANGKGKSSDLTAVMLNSSLADSLGELLQQDIQIDGSLSADLRLEIPLDDEDATRATGDVYLSNNSVYVPRVDLRFENTTGTVSFDNENINIKGVNAELWQQALQINALGEQKDDDYIVDIDATGQWAFTPLANELGEDFASLFTGDTALSLAVNLQFMPESFYYTARIDSQLEGLGADLPVPFNKSAEQQLPLLITSSGDSTASSVAISLGKLASFDGALAHKEGKFNRAHLALGPSELATRGVGFSISSDLESMDFMQWFDFVSTIVDGDVSSENSILGAPERVYLESQKVTIAGQTFTDVGAVFKRLDDQWQIEMDGNEIRGKLTLHDDWYTKGINSTFEYINIAQLADLPSRDPATVHNPRDFPAIDFTCKSCSLNGMQLGRIELEAVPNAFGLEISQLLLDNGDGSLSMTGQWLAQQTAQATILEGELNSNSFGSFLKQLGFDTGIQDSRADMNVALSWESSPFDFSLAKLNGDIDWQLSDGYLAEVSDKGSRIFTLLSLNSLVRKLSLDFRDVFAKGFFYDDMQGSVQITDGKADTRDTKIDGAAGEIEIYGYTDLATSQLNYNVSFTPNVTGNLPVLVYFFTVSPPSALAALAIDKMLTSAKVISNVNYSVTGTIDEPVLIETGRESTEVALPARREPNPDLEKLPPFVPPQQKDLIDIEVKDDDTDSSTG